MKALTPSSAIPLAYYLFAHASLGTALLALAVDPALPSGSFYQPRIVAIVHLLTIAWLSGSILGSFYIVAPLALRVPMPGGKGDWIAFASFVAGTSGMVSHFWINTYDGMAWSATLVTAAIAWVGARGCRGLPQSSAPWPVTLHVALAFVNMLAAAALGILIGFDRSRGVLGLSPLAAMFAHAHLAAVGWAAMMVVGLSYRLIPMILPAAMPAGTSLAISAILIEAGLAVLVATLLTASSLTWTGALLIVAGLVSFVTHIRRTVAHRMASAGAACPRLVDVAGSRRVRLAARRGRAGSCARHWSPGRGSPHLHVDLWCRGAGRLSRADCRRHAGAAHSVVRLVSRVRRERRAAGHRRERSAIRQLRAPDLHPVDAGRPDHGVGTACGEPLRNPPRRRVPAVRRHPWGGLHASHAPESAHLTPSPLPPYFSNQPSAISIARITPPPSPRGSGGR